MAKQTFSIGQVLLASQLTSLQQTAMLGGAASAKVASYILVAADAGTSITMSNASATTITVNTALFATGDTVQITNLLAGVCTITAGTATVNTSSSLALSQFESGTLIFISTSSAIFIKGAGAASATGNQWNLLNSGGTSLSGAGTTISGLTGKEQLFILVQGASSSVASTISVRVNTLSTNIYFPFGGNNQATSAYTVANIVSTTSADGAAMNQIVLAQMSTDTASTVSGYCLITGCASSTNIKMFQAAGGGTSVTGNNHTTRSFGGYIQLTSQISSITIAPPGGGTLDAGTVFVYANS